MKKYLGAGLVLTIVFSACGGSDKPKTESATFNSVGNGTSLITGKTVSTSLMGGTWISNCENNAGPSRDGGGSHQEHYTFYTDGVGLYSTNYSDADCVTPAISIYAYVNGPSVMSATNQNIFTADYAANSDTNSYYVPQSASMVASLKDEHACGLSGWVLNQPADVDGTPCALASAAGGSATHVTFHLSDDHQAMTLVSCATSGRRSGTCDAAIDLTRQ